MPHHKGFGEVFAAFEPGSGGRRAYDGNTFQFIIVFEVIVYPFYQRIFGAYDNHVDIVSDGKLFQCGKVGRRKSDITAYAGCSGITRGDIQIFYAGALGDFPSKGVFPTTRA